ncbi:hypothetical protein L7F22_041642 [Adiantum nelumboides]|nr:hypothetical protein [Adiantum nelumboides]
MATEQTFIMVKPDGVQRGLVGEIVGRFEKRGYQLVNARWSTPRRSTSSSTTLTSRASLSSLVHQVGPLRYNMRSTAH